MAGICWLGMNACRGVSRGRRCGITVTRTAPRYSALWRQAGWSDFERVERCRSTEAWKDTALSLCREAAKAELSGNGAAGAEPNGAARGERQEGKKERRQKHPTSERNWMWPACLRWQTRESVFNQLPLVAPLSLCTLGIQRNEMKFCLLFLVLKHIDIFM